MLDLEALFVVKLNAESLQIGEYYRRAAITYRLRKPESRQLLKRLIERGLAKYEGKVVSFSSTAT